MLSRLSDRERLSVGILALIGGLMRLALAFRPPARLATRPYIEDAFYAFSCAWHLALGQGFTVDGVHPTNGVQPLICILYAPFFWLTSNKWMGLQSTLALQALIQVASTILIAMLAKRLARTEQRPTQVSPSIVAAAIWTFSMQLFIHNTNGLETGLVAMLLLWITLLLVSHTTWPRAIAIAVLSGLLILARLDAIVFVALTCIWLLIRKQSLMKAIVVGVIAALVALPWLLYGYMTFGHIMPISGLSESSHALQVSTILENVWEAAVALADITSIFVYHQLSAVPQWANALWVVLIFTFIFFVTRRTPVTSVLRKEYALSPLMPLAVFGVFVFVYYTVFFGAPHFLSRYLHPIRVLFVILTSLSIPIALERFPLRTAGKVVVSIVAVVIALFTVERYVNNFTTSSISDLYQAGVWAKDHSNANVGMEQSGTSGFVASNVINLDGKVNADALHARLNGALGQYVAHHVQYLADWPDLIQPTLSDAARAGVVFDPIDTIGRVVVYQRRF